MLALLLASALTAAPEAPASRRPPAAAAPAARAPASDPAAAALAAGGAAYAEREDPARLAEALQRLRDAAALAPSDPVPLIALARPSTGSPSPPWAWAGRAG